MISIAMTGKVFFVHLMLYIEKNTHHLTIVLSLFSLIYPFGNFKVFLKILCIIYIHFNPILIQIGTIWIPHHQRILILVYMQNGAPFEHQIAWRKKLCHLKEWCQISRNQVITYVSLMYKLVKLVLLGNLKHWIYMIH